MGYEILYDRRFIRTTRGIIPMLLSGSNNVTTIQYDRAGRRREVRERHWWAYIPRSMDIKDHPEGLIMAEFEKMGNSGMDRELFMWHGSWLMESQHRKWFQNGCKDARTLEEYLRSNRVASFSAEIRVYPDKKKFSRDTEMFSYLRSTRELEDWLDQAQIRLTELKTALGDVGEAFVHLEFTPDEPLTVLPLIEGKVVVMHKNSYLIAFGRNSLSFGQDKEAALQFDSIEAAQLALGTQWENLRYVRATTALKEKNWVLRLDGGTGLTRYTAAKKRSRAAVYWAFSVQHARRYAHKSDAIRDAKMLAQLRESGRLKTVLTGFSVINTETEEEFSLDVSANPIAASA